jgi:hypothetical protein
MQIIIQRLRYAEERSYMQLYMKHERIRNMPKYSVKTIEGCSMKLELVGNCRQSFVVIKQ